MALACVAFIRPTFIYLQSLHIFKHIQRNKSTKKSAFKVRGPSQTSCLGLTIYSCLSSSVMVKAFKGHEACYFFLLFLNAFEILLKLNWLHLCNYTLSINLCFCHISDIKKASNDRHQNAGKQKRQGVVKWGNLTNKHRHLIEIKTFTLCAAEYVAAGRYRVTE